MFCCSVIVGGLDRGVVDPGGLQTPLFCGCVLSGCWGPVAMYTGRVPGVFAQDAEFLCAQAGSPLHPPAPFLAPKKLV